MTIPDDPITTLRTGYRDTLDLQAARSIEARALRTRVAEVTTELTTLRTRANAYKAILDALEKAARPATKRDD